MTDDLISRQQAIDALMERFKRVPTNAIIAKDVIENLPFAQPETNCSEIPNNSDAISRQAAIEPEAISKWKKEFREYVDSLDIARDDWKGIVEYIDDVPTVQPDLDEWCTDCKEYDFDKHCCPRFNRVIRGALNEAQPKVIVLCADCIKRDKCKFYDTQGDGGYCRYGRDKDGRFNPQTAGD